MAFRVFAEAASGRTVFSSAHETAGEALAKLVELMTSGLVNVHVVDTADRRFTPAEFAREIGSKPIDTEPAID